MTPSRTAASAPARSAPAESAPADRPARGGLLGLNAAALMLVSVPYALRGLDPVRLADFQEYYGFFPVIVAALVTMLAACRGSRHRERRFWRLWALSFGLLALIRVLYLREGQLIRGEFTVDVLYVLFYFGIIVALQVRPDRLGARSREPIPWMETVSTATFLLGLLVYFIVVPETVSPGALDTWVPSLMLYGTLDAYVLASLVHLHQTSTSPRWRVVYGWLSLGALGWLVTDLYEALYWMGRVDWLAGDSPWNIAWFAPYTLMGVAAAWGDVPRPLAFAAVGRRPAREVRLARRMGMLVVFAAVLPILHIVASLFGLLDEPSRGAREVTVLFVLPILLAMAYVHQRLLEAHSRRLEAASAELERKLQQAHRMEALGTLAGGIAHDFNNILAAIVGYAELLRDEAPEDGPALRDLDEILRATERARNLTSQILTFSRQEEPRRAATTLGGTVNEALRLIRPTVPSSVELSIDVDDDVGLIRAEQGRIHQVVMNPV